MTRERRTCEVCGCSFAVDSRYPGATTCHGTGCRKCRTRCFIVAALREPLMDSRGFQLAPAYLLPDGSGGYRANPGHPEYRP